MLKRFFIILLVFIAASCVPGKDLIYLQGEPIAKKDVYLLNNQPYRLQVDDVLSINLKAEEEKYVALFKKTNIANQSNGGGFENGYSAQAVYSIDRHGNIRLPIIGELNVLGFTTKEVRVKLEEMLLKYIKDKETFFVSVNLTGIKFTIFGEIADPGTKIINQNSVNIFEAISNSGDITLIGNRKKVVLWRVTNGERKKYNIDLTKVEAFDSEIYYIQPNDMIYVVPLKQKSWGTGTTGLQSLTTLVSIFTLVTSTILLVRNL